jgi:predicted  nucleic acid-binding Zn-ribbon protein
MAKQKEVTVEEKLKALYALQIIDSKIDELRSVRGELPLEVEDLEDEVAGLNTRLSKIQSEVEQLESEIKDKKLAIGSYQELAKKYTEQQKNVRNNREFDSLTKEIEYQDLEIKLSEKRINEFNLKISQKNELIAETNEKMAELNSHLSHKKAELEAIMKETEKDENILLAKSDEYGKLIDEQLLKAYKRIRSKVVNGLAVVAIERGASGGSFFTIPPQVQIEIASRKKIIIDEHSGRILVDALLADEVKATVENLIS